MALALSDHPIFLDLYIRLKSEMQDTVADSNQGSEVH